MYNAVGELYETQVVDLEQAVHYYAEAVSAYEMEDSDSSADKIKLKVCAPPRAVGVLWCALCFSVCCVCFALFFFSPLVVCYLCIAGDGLVVAIFRNTDCGVLSPPSSKVAHIKAQQEKFDEAQQTYEEVATRMAEK